ncbi:MAG: SLC13 family permease [Deltaproteobacteria bacterium]|nr:SLC13 family permease [Deltaproteobacteria bacterium]
MTLKRAALFLGPVLSIIFVFFFHLEPERPQVTYTAAVALLMAIWWVTEAIPLAVTALLPVVLFPLLGVMKGKVVSALYFNDVILLFIGGFIIALAMQRWGLHKRIALKIMLKVGGSPWQTIFGFMGATAFLSMWISNTAATMVMAPIAMAIIAKLKESFGEREVSRFSTGLLLGIAYAASIGGMATLIGTPPNLAFVKIFSICFPKAPEISFAKWFSFAFPLSVVFFLCTWSLVVLLFCRDTRFKVNLDMFYNEYRRLGPMRPEERIVMFDFVLLALLWFTRKDIPIGGFKIPGWSSIFPIPRFIDDGTVAITMALPLFFIPAKGHKTIMDWETASQLPWGIVLLFGGGFALAAGFESSGLSAWFGKQLEGLSFLHPILIMIAVCVFMMILTQFTSNTASTQMILPIVAGVSVSIKSNPLFFMIPATLSASCAFMLPVSTPPNAIIFGLGTLRVSDMAKIGTILNILGIILIIACVSIFGRIFLGGYTVPAWVFNR